MAVAEEPQRPTRRTRFRRQLRSRIILAFVLLGFGLTALFAWATNWTRNRVENQIIEDVMNRNIDQAARQFEAGGDTTFAVEQIKAFVYTPDKFDAARVSWPEWSELDDGIYGMTGVAPDGKPFSYKLAVRKTPKVISPSMTARAAT